MNLEFVSDLNDFIQANKELVTLIAVPAVAWLVTYLTNKSAERRSTEQRKVERTLERELKLSEYRQAWIREIREELAEIISFDATGKDAPDDVQKINILITSVLLRMNPREDASKKVFEQLQKLINFKGKEHELDDLRLETINYANIFLKLEWDRLKSDLESIEVLESEIQ